MSYERGGGIGTPGAEPPPAQAATATSDALPPALRLQILATEHWSLLASRSLAWNEVFNRAAMFLSTVAGAIVALALVAQASDFGSGFRRFALVILPVVLFVGVGTLFRLRASNYHDAICVIGMNRIRAAYLELAPELQPYFVTGTTEDFAGITKTMALEPRQPFIAQMLASTPTMIATLNSILAGAIVALLSIELGVPEGGALAIGAVLFVLVFALHMYWGMRAVASTRASLLPEDREYIAWRFGPPGDSDASTPGRPRD
jgi:hypothetical protein